MHECEFDCKSNTIALRKAVENENLDLVIHLVINHGLIELAFRSIRESKKYEFLEMFLENYGADTSTLIRVFGLGGYDNMGEEARKELKPFYDIVERHGKREFSVRLPDWDTYKSRLVHKDGIR